MACVVCRVCFFFVFHGLSFVFQRSASAFDDLGGGSGNVCLHSQNSNRKKRNADRPRAMRNCALVRLEGDAAALEARPFRVRQLMMLTQRLREVAAAEFFDLRLLQSRLLGISSPDLSTTSAPNLQKKLHKKNEQKKLFSKKKKRKKTKPYKQKLDKQHFPHGENWVHARFLYLDLGPKSSFLTFATIYSCLLIFSSVSQSMFRFGSACLPVWSVLQKCASSSIQRTQKMSTTMRTNISIKS